MWKSLSRFQRTIIYLFSLIFIFTLVYFSLNDSANLVEIAERSEPESVFKEVLTNIKNDPRDVDNEPNNGESVNQVLEEPDGAHVDSNQNNQIQSHDGRIFSGRKLYIV